MASAGLYFPVIPTAEFGCTATLLHLPGRLASLAFTYVSEHSTADNSHGSMVLGSMP